MAFAVTGQLGRRCNFFLRAGYGSSHALPAGVAPGECASSFFKTVRCSVASTSALELSPAGGLAGGGLHSSSNPGWLPATGCTSDGILMTDGRWCDRGNLSMTLSSPGSGPYCGHSKGEVLGGEVFHHGGK
ncbi:unnamed protein product [Pleuronectes platessa]|uniref:Uncharacterized protein n=1 Tax=Pleuronectes platessa TaxID=8262 RepID=A0A9N7Y684_PLEPL|nr:unnamed protein product [Pleuronectes platessa]